MAIEKIIGITSCSFMLCLSLSSTIQASENMKLESSCVDRKGVQSNPTKSDAGTRQGIEIVTGEVLYMDGTMFYVQRFDGKEVNWCIDATTQMNGLMNGLIGRGDRIAATVSAVDDQKRVLLIHKLEAE